MSGGVLLLIVIAFGLGPMAGQLNHFKHYARETLPYAIKRYEDEVNRLYGVMNLRLRNREFLAGKYSIADMAIFPWLRSWQNQGIDWADYPHLKAWFDTIAARPAVQKAVQVLADARKPLVDDKARHHLFGAGQLHKR